MPDRLAQAARRADNLQMRSPCLVAAFVLLATPALAQFPPPGVYKCVSENGANLGELTLFVAGDYSFRNVDGNSASGQVASAGTDVNPISGPLKDMQLTGVFGTDDTGKTTFRFTGADGLEVSCR
jgi:hypothetical protein